MAVAYILLGAGLGISSLGIMDLFNIVYCIYLYYTLKSVKFRKAFNWNNFLSIILFQCFVGNYFSTKNV